jgi:hypothetical protein
MNSPRPHDRIGQSRVATVDSDATPAIIDQVAQADPAWLTLALRSAGVLVQGHVVEASSELMSVGQAGLVARLHLRYDTGATDAPKTAILKLPANDPGSRAIGAALGIYAAEVHFYLDIAPTVRVRAPRAYWGQAEADTGRFTLLIEDVAGAGEPGDMIIGSSPDQAERALRALVDLQAPRWKDPALRALPFLSDAARTRAMFAGVEPALPAFLERFADVVDGDDLAMVERCAPRAAAWGERMTADDAVLVHGDFRMDNMLFPRQPSAPVALFDWQMIRLGPPLIDACFYIATCLKVDDRRQHERALLLEYHRGLLAAGVTGFSFDDVWESYRWSVFYGLLLTVPFSIQLERTERGDALFRTMIRSHCEQVRDLGAEPLLFGT